MLKIFSVLLFAFFFSASAFAQQNFSVSANNAFTLNDTGTTSIFLKKFNMSPPYNLIPIGSGSTEYKSGIEFGAPGYLYFIGEHSSFQFILERIDTATAVVTQISTTPFYFSGINYGLSWDRTNNTMYTIFNSPATIYTVNLTSGTFTLVNALTPSEHVIAFAVNNAGSMFGVSTLGNKFLRINKATGQTTNIGVTNLSTNDIYGCDFDPFTGKMYMLVQNGSNTDVYNVDTATGIGTVTGTISRLVNSLAIAGNTFVGINNISSEIPPSYSLLQNYPNPFNPSTNIRYEIPKNSLVKIVVLDELGREIETLVNERQNAGTYEVTLNATHYSSGVYFYRLTTEGYNETKKMMLIK